MGVLRDLFRGLERWRSAYETYGIDTLTTPDGVEWSIHDLEYLYTVAMETLPPSRSRAIDLCLVQGYREWEAAEMMGVSITNPVSMYATKGLQKLVRLIESGQLPRFRTTEGEAA